MKLVVDPLSARAQHGCCRVCVAESYSIWSTIQHRSRRQIAPSEYHDHNCRTGVGSPVLAPVVHARTRAESAAESRWNGDAPPPFHHFAAPRSTPRRRYPFLPPVVPLRIERRPARTSRVGSCRERPPSRPHSVRPGDALPLHTPLHVRRGVASGRVDPCGKAGERSWRGSGFRRSVCRRGPIRPGTPPTTP